ncbi:MAG: hypothetical protein V1874_17755 [Spirochaetota bacterium]
MLKKYLMVVLFLLLTGSLSPAGNSTKDNSWIVINALLVDKNNVTIKLIYFDSPATNVKANARRSCKDGVNIILPEYMLKKYEGDPLRVDFDLKNAKYKIYQKSGDKIISSGSLMLEL